MRWRGQRQSTNVEDRRGMRVSRGGMVGVSVGGTAVGVAVAVRVAVGVAVRVAVGTGVKVAVTRNVSEGGCTFSVTARTFAHGT